MTRIISGKFKGRKIIATNITLTRPTTDFAKEALFSMLASRFDFNDLKVLILYSGIGSIDYEFLSRGTKQIVSVEKDINNYKFIEKTLVDLDSEHYVQLICMDVFKYLSRSTIQQYDIIFADPPFTYSTKEYSELLELVLIMNQLKNQGIFILEHNKKAKGIPEYQLLQKRNYGSVCFSIYGDNESFK